MTTRNWLAGAAVALALAACATGPRLSDAQKLDLYRAHAGAPVKDFHYFNDLNGWTDLGDSALAVWTRPSEAYLLELWGPCPDLQFTPAIGLTSQFGTVSANFDEVRVLRQPGTGPAVPCRIKEIRPLDVKGLRASERELRQVQQQERTQQAPGAQTPPSGSNPG